MLRPQICQWDGGTCCPLSTRLACSLLSASAQHPSFPAWISLVGGWHGHHWVQIYGPSSGCWRVSTWLCLFTVSLFLLCSDRRMTGPWRLCSPASEVFWIPARFGQRECRKVRGWEKRETACLPPAMGYTACCSSSFCWRPQSLGSSNTHPSCLSFSFRGASNFLL